MGQQPTKERRAGPRVIVREAGLMYYIKQALLSKSSARADGTRASVVDLSRTGLRFRTSRKLKEGQALMLTLQIDKGSAAVELEGKVAWVGAEERDGRSFVGVHFTDYKGAAWQVLREFDKG